MLQLKNYCKTRPPKSIGSEIANGQYTKSGTRWTHGEGERV